MARRRSHSRRSSRRSHRSHWLLNLLGALVAIVLGVLVAGSLGGVVSPGVVGFAFVILFVGLLLAH